MSRTLGTMLNNILCEFCSLFQYIGCCFTDIHCMVCISCDWKETTLKNVLFRFRVKKLNYKEYIVFFGIEIQVRTIKLQTIHNSFSIETLR